MILLLRRRTKMAKVTVKLFGVLRMDTKLKAEEINIDKVEDIFDSLNLIVDERFEEIPCCLTPISSRLRTRLSLSTANAAQKRAKSFRTAMRSGCFRLPRAAEKGVVQCHLLLT